MKKRHFLNTSLLLMAGVFVLGSCTFVSREDYEKYNSIAYIQFDNTSYEIEKNSGWYQISYSIVDINNQVLDNSNFEVSYSSRDDKIADYINNMIYGNGVGSTFIEVKIKLPDGIKDQQKYKASAVVSVHEEISATNALESVSIIASKSKLDVGESTTYSYSHLPSESSIKKVEWTSSNPNKASINQSGYIQALEKGTTTITLKATDSNNIVQSDSVDLVIEEPVINVSVDSIAISCPTNELVIDQNASTTLTYIVSPANATYSAGEIVWTSGNTDIITIDDSGKLVAKNSGTTHVQVMLKDKTGRLNVTVRNEGTPIVTLNSFSFDSSSYNVMVGSTIQTTYTLNPSNARIIETEFKLQQSNYASIAQSGAVTGVLTGSTTLTAEITTLDQVGNYVVRTADTVINVIPYEAPTLTGIILNPNTEQTLEIGETLTISATPDPAGAKINSAWSSSAPTVASVSSKGVVTAKSAGTTIITIKDLTTQISNSVSIQVNAPKEEYNTLESVSFNNISYSVQVGSSVQTSYTLNPSDAKVVSLRYELDSSNYCSVNSTGRVTGSSAGSTSLFIYVTTLDQDGNQVIRSASTNIVVSAVVAPTLTGITISPSGNQSLTAGDTLQLSLTAVPSGASLGTVTYNSATTSVATISSSGKITAVSAGTSVISVSSGSVSSNFVLTVTEASSGGDDENDFNGYYRSAKGLKGSALVAQLKNIIGGISTPTKGTNYAWARFQSYDEDLEDSSSILCIYSRKTYLKTYMNSGGATGWNREHTYPQNHIENALGSSSGALWDNHHMFASDPKLNSTRSNHPFGTVSGSTYCVDSEGRTSECKYANGYFEPCDPAKGEVARATFYMNVVWGLSITTNFATLDLALTWNSTFGTTIREDLRNDRVQNTQGNRNPFIDYPHWAEICFDSSYSGPGAFM